MMKTVEGKPRSRRSRFLLVEDDDTHAALFIHSAYSSLDVHVDRARSLRAAINSTKETPPQIVILDLGLPESDGLETLKGFLRECPDTPVIVLTTISDISLGEKSLQLGAMDFLSKDEIDEKTLVRSVRYSLERWSQRQKLQSSLADLEYFGNTAAHDLISPLNAISGFTQLIEVGLKGSSVDKEVFECLDLLKQSSERAANLVNDLHKFAKLGKSAISRKRIDMNQLVEEAKISLKSLIDDSDATIVSSDLPTLNGDSGLIAHVIQNLIGNALKYSRPDVPAKIQIDSERIDGYTTIRVVDNGIGIPTSDNQRVFLPFERLKTPIATSGSGLGLSICKRIVDAHQGKIWIETQQPDGATFLFHLGKD